MTLSEIVTLKLQPAIKECHIHQHRLDYACEALREALPLSADKWQALDDETVARIDQLLFRYNKLQDAMGQRLFPAILALGGEWRDEETFIDKLNRLERLGAIPSAEQWNELRQIRNRMTHEYPDAPELNAANINCVASSIGDLKTALARAEAYGQDLAARLVSR